MSLLGNLQNFFGRLGESITGAGETGTQGGAVTASAADVPSNSLSSMLGPAAMGGLVGLLSGRGMSGLLKGGLLGGGAALLWDKYKNRISDENKGKPGYGASTVSDADRAHRMIRALVFAAKADGHISDSEKTAISRQIKELGTQAQNLVQQAMNEPLDPNLIARDVSDPEEALQLFTISCAVADSDNFMVGNYLDALASALNIPRDVRQDLLSKVKARG